MAPPPPAAPPPLPGAPPPPPGAAPPPTAANVAANIKKLVAAAKDNPNQVAEGVVDRHAALMDELREYVKAAKKGVKPKRATKAKEKTKVPDELLGDVKELEDPEELKKLQEMAALMEQEYLENLENKEPEEKQPEEKEPEEKGSEKKKSIGEKRKGSELDEQRKKKSAKSGKSKSGKSKGGKSKKNKGEKPGMNEVNKEKTGEEPTAEKEGGEGDSPTIPEIIEPVLESDVGILKPKTGEVDEEKTGEVGGTTGIELGEKIPEIIESVPMTDEEKNEGNKPIMGEDSGGIITEPALEPNATKANNTLESKISEVTKEPSLYPKLGTGFRKEYPILGTGVTTANNNNNNNPSEPKISEVAKELSLYPKLGREKIGETSNMQADVLELPCLSYCSTWFQDYLD